jgi:hypothetical protein
VNEGNQDKMAPKKKLSMAAFKELRQVLRGT